MKSLALVLVLGVALTQSLPIEEKSSNEVHRLCMHACLLSQGTPARVVQICTKNSSFPQTSATEIVRLGISEPEHSPWSSQLQSYYYC
jgi:hypothetical protein